MDYSLLVGIHDVERYEQEQQETEATEANGIDEDEGSGSGGEVLTPPDSPSPRAHLLSSGEYEFDFGCNVYAVRCTDGKKNIGWIYVLQSSEISRKSGALILRYSQKRE